MKANFYYQRRLFLTLLYIVAGLLFTSFPIIGLVEPTQKKDFEYFKGTPTKLEVVDTMEGEEFKRFLTVGIHKKSKKTIIDKNSFEKLQNSLVEIGLVKKTLDKTYETPVGIVKLYNYSVVEKDLDKVVTEVFYNDEFIKEISVNNNKITVYKDTSKSFFWFFVVLGLLWIIWQVKTLITVLKSKPTDLYNN